MTRNRPNPWSNSMSVAVVLAVLTALCGCAGHAPGTVSQFGTLGGLMRGEYDGGTTCAMVVRAGDLGLGTFDRVDGEMILVDGVIYQAKVDGSVDRPPGNLKTPFATVTRFRPSSRWRTTGNTPQRVLEKVLDRLADGEDFIVAFRIDGEFDAMTVRSVPAQSPPYPTLPEVINRQTVFELGAVRGTVVGFRFPTDFAGINAPGYHFHFVSDDRRSGGHVLEMSVGRDAVVSIAEFDRFELRDINASGQ